MNNKKAKHYYELAAMNGRIDARHKLGVERHRKAIYIEQ